MTLGFALLSFSSTAVLAADPALDSPNEGLEEITVTATRHAEPAEHVPVSTLAPRTFGLSANYKFGAE